MCGVMCLYRTERSSVSRAVSGSVARTTTEGAGVLRMRRGSVVTVPPDVEEEADVPTILGNELIIPPRDDDWVIGTARVRAAA